MGVLSAMMLVGVLAIDAITRKRQSFHAFFANGFAAIFAGAVNPFIDFTQSRFDLFNCVVGIAGKFK